MISKYSPCSPQILHQNWQWSNPCPRTAGRLKAIRFYSSDWTADEPVCPNPIHIGSLWFADCNNGAPRTTYLCQMHPNAVILLTCTFVPKYVCVYSELIISSRVQVFRLREYCKQYFGNIRLRRLLYNYFRRYVTQILIRR